MKRRKVSLSSAQIACLRSIIGSAKAGKTKKRHLRKRRISAAHRRKLLKNLAKARRVRARRSRR